MIPTILLCFLQFHCNFQAMESHTFMFSSFMIISLVNFLSMGHVRGTVYQVGDAEGWSTSVNYLAWSEKYNFVVGDVLVFNYVKTEHDVYQVTQGTFRSCDTSTGVLGTYESGNDRITLKEAKSYWFICNVSGHCLGGMKFGVNVKNSNATKTNALPPISELTPDVEVSGNLIQHMRGWKWVCNLLAFWTLILLHH